MVVMRRILVLQIAALGHAFLEQNGVKDIGGAAFRRARSLFPALTCPVQAMFRTGLPPARNAMFFNGFYEHDLQRPFFWEQSCRLVKGERIWQEYRNSGGKCAMLFWQQSLGEEVDYLLSPAPVHTHGGGMIDAVYAKPADLYDNICSDIGSRFRLHSYWGPLAGLKSSTFIAQATCNLMGRDDAPELIFSYLPHLDYALQKHGPDHPKASRALSELMDLLSEIVSCCSERGYEFLFFGDYAIGKATRVLFPNRALYMHGLFQARRVKNRLYPDYCSSDAFAVTDHEVAFIYLNNKGKYDKCLEAIRGMDAEISVMEREQMAASGLFADSGPDFIITASPGTWFAYPWWEEPGEAPDFATHVDIHNKPGFDPCELFFGWHPFVISTDTSKVGGTHGHNSEERDVAWATSLDIKAHESGDIALQLKQYLGGRTA